MSNARVLFTRFESVQQSKKFFDFAHGLVFVGIIIVMQLQIVEYYDFSCPRLQTEARACVEEVT